MNANKFENIEKTFSEFESFQSEVLDAISYDKHKFIANIENFQNSMNIFNEKIKRVVAELVDELNKSNKTIEEGFYWNQRLKVVIDNISLIYNEVEKVQSELKNEINTIKKGKKAILSYHSKQNQRPFFLSDDV